jgi:predicted transglutaminase-like cysteine proteinase
MARSAQIFSLLIVATATLFTGAANARSRLAQDFGLPEPIVEASPTLAPFQHVRFCLRYPAECKSDAHESERIDANAANLDLLTRINHDVNVAIAPTAKNYGPDLKERWTIAPVSGDCNDYAVTKWHQMVESGLPARALRLAVVETASGTGHLVLIVATTNGDIVLDNLIDTIRPWQNTNYRWLKIQSSADARFWYDIKAPTVEASESRAYRKFRLANR